MASKSLNPLEGYEENVFSGRRLLSHYRRLVVVGKRRFGLKEEALGAIIACAIDQGMRVVVVPKDDRGGSRFPVGNGVDQAQNLEQLSRSVAALRKSGNDAKVLVVFDNADTSLVAQFVSRFDELCDKDRTSVVVSNQFFSSSWPPEGFFDGILIGRVAGLSDTGGGGPDGALSRIAPGLRSQLPAAIDEIGKAHFANSALRQSLIIADLSGTTGEIGRFPLT